MFVKSPKYGAKLKATQVDWWGIILLTIFIGSLQFVLEHGQQDDWFEDSTIIALSIASFFGFILFIWRELVYEHPIVNLRVLRDSNLKIGTLMTFIMGFGIYGTTFIIPIYTQAILGWTATDAGLLLIPSSITIAFMMPIIGKLLERGVSQKYMVATGFSLFFVFCLWMHNIMTPDTGGEHMFWPLVVRGLGLGLLFVPITTLALSSLKGKDIGEGAAFTGMMRQLGGSFGIAIITTMISRLNQQHRVDLIPNLSAVNANVQQRIQGLQQMFISKGFSTNEALARAYQILEGTITKQTTVLSYMEIFLYLGIMFLLCVPFVLLIRKGAGKVDTSAVH
tara:strand:- start:339 stop:1349 length:1011 start_codon:yes stop_codon:yes gene_type:complete